MNNNCKKFNNSNERTKKREKKIQKKETTSTKYLKTAVWFFFN